MANPKIHCKLPSPCKPVTVEPIKQPTPAFDLCVGDYAIHWDGTHLTHTRPRTTPNGTYGSVTLQDGCIVGYGECEVPTYTPPYCNPAPLPCGQLNGTPTTGGTTTTIVETPISSRQGNQLAKDSFGLYVRVYVSVGQGLTISGQGLQNDPYLINFAPNTGGVQSSVVKSESPLTHTERDGVTYIGMPQSGVQAGTYGPFTIDSYGRITQAKNSSFLTADDIHSIGDEISVTPIANGINLSLPTSTAGNTSYVLGAYSLGISPAGRIVAAQRNINVTGGVYRLGIYRVAINEFGSIAAIDQEATVPTEAGTFTTTDGKKVHYDETGRITTVETTTAAPTADLPLPIRDMYKFALSKASGDSTVTIDGDIFGTSLEYGAGTSATQGIFVYKLPTYVKTVANIQVYHTGNVTITADLDNLTLTVKLDQVNGAGKGTATAVLRG